MFNYGNDALGSSSF